jgi:hypothetical protein
MSGQDRAARRLLLQQTRGLPIHVVREGRDDTSGIVSLMLELAIGEESVATSALGLIYAFGLLSFGDALPAGLSRLDYRHQDEFTVVDFLEHLSYRLGRLHFYVDYLRGRLLKTMVDINQDGTVLLQTVNRGDLAKRWVAILQGDGEPLPWDLEDSGTP